MDFLTRRCIAGVLLNYCLVAHGQQAHITEKIKSHVQVQKCLFFIDCNFDCNMKAGLFILSMLSANAATDKQSGPFALLHEVEERQQQTKGIAMSLMTHVMMLEEKHGKLEQMITDESVRPLPDFSVIQTLKKQKLLLKEEVRRIKEMLGERHDAA